MIKIKDSDLEFKFVKSRGPGGQNVNKVSTAVQLKFQIYNSSLSEEEVVLFKANYPNKISKSGYVIIYAQNHRTQNLNKKEAINKLHQLFSDINIPVKRILTKPSKSSIEKRLKTKKRKSIIKQNRKKVTNED
jgi:ribosome-associated protein